MNIPRCPAAAVAVSATACVASCLLLGPPEGASIVAPRGGPRAAVAAASGSCGELARDLGFLDDDPALVDLPPADRKQLSRGIWQLCQVNAVEYDERRGVIRKLRARVRALQARVEVGADEHERLATATQRLVSAEARHADWLERMREGITGGLSSGARAALEGMRDKRVLPVAYRRLELSREQRSTLQMARARHYARLALAASTAEREAIQIENEEAIFAILGRDKAILTGDAPTNTCHCPGRFANQLAWSERVAQRAGS